MVDFLGYAVLGSWLEFALRWLHVITAIAWIGSSFYFIALDLGLVRRPGLPEGVTGEEWQVHGGGFYHIQKYGVAPAHMPEHLTWFKWESYATWLSGFALMAVLYYMSADLYLIDANKLDMTPLMGVGLSIGSIVLGWLIYDVLCRSTLGRDPTKLMVLLFGVLVVMSWAYAQVFTGRAALLHLGVFTATIMTANVAMIIIPNQKIVVADLRAGRVPDAKYGVIAKQRSTHNNYLTLPVIFLMLSNHYPLAFASQWNWLIAALVFLMGVSIRHYFNTMHARKGRPNWTWAVTVVLFGAIVWLSTLERPGGAAAAAPAPLRGVALAMQQAPDFEEAYFIVLGRCSMCHAVEPVWDGIVVPPKGLVLESEEDSARHARAIYLHSARSTAMPPANVTWMEPEERAALRAWYEGALARR